MKQEKTLIASAPTEKALLKIVQSYFYSPGIFFADNEVHNSTGAIKNFAVTQKGSRWRFERIHQQ